MSLQEPILADECVQRGEKKRITTDHFVVDWSKHFPQAFCADGVLRVADALKLRGVKEPLPPHSVCGPALPVAFRATAAGWIFHAIFPWAAWFVCDCYGQEADVSSYVWYIIIPYLIYLLVLEWRCMQWTLVPQFQVVGCLDVGFAVPWHLWIVATYTLSFISHTDLATNGLFMILMLKTRFCPAGPALEHLWQDTMKQSAWSHIPGFLNISPSFAWLTFMLWLIMFSQVIFAVAAATPLSKIHAVVKGTPLVGFYNWLAVVRNWTSPCHEVVYEVADVETILQYIFEGKSILGTFYQTLLDKNSDTSDHVGALFALAEANRMVSITGMRTTYSRKKAVYFIDHQQPTLALYLLRRNVQMWQQKVLLVGVLENAFQLNLQITHVAMQHHIDRNGTSTVTIVSISAGFIMALKNIANAYTGQRFIAQTLDEAAGTNTMRRTIYMGLIRLRVYFVIYLLLIIYAFAKFVAIWFCNGSMLNITGCAAV